MSVNRPTPIDEEVIWDKTKNIKSRTDSKGVIDYVNQTFIDVCGYSKEELIGQPHNIIRHPDMPRVIFKVLWDNIEKGNNFNAVVKNLSKSGKYYWIVTNFDIFKDSSGVPLFFMGIRRSVSDVIVQKVSPIYKELIEIEKTQGLEASEKHLKKLLTDYNGNYNEFIKAILAADGIDVSFW